MPDKTLFADYLKEQFKSTEDERTALCGALEMILAVRKTIKNDSITVGQMREELLRQYSESELNETMKKFDELQGHDLILCSPKSFDFDDEDEWE